MQLLQQVISHMACSERGGHCWHRSLCLFEPAQAVALTTEVFDIRMGRQSCDLSNDGFSPVDQYVSRYVFGQGIRASRTWSAIVTRCCRYQAAFRGEYAGLNTCTKPLLAQCSPFMLRQQRGDLHCSAHDLQSLTMTALLSAARSALL